MIVWLNGAFGAGKTSTANELVRLLPNARVYDPEQVGFLLQGLLPELDGDFQDWPPWRSLVVHTAVHVHRFVAGTLITPMTLLRADYATEIFNGLAANALPVTHVVLHVEADELIRRIQRDQAMSDGARRWRLDHIANYQQALDWLTDTAEVIDSTALTPAQAAREIAGRLRAAANNWNGQPPGPLEGDPPASSRPTTLQ
jgi:hypothetical protein